MVKKDYKQKYRDLVKQYNQTVKMYEDAIKERDRKIIEANENTVKANREILRLRELLGYDNRKYSKDSKYLNSSSQRYGEAYYTKRMYDQDKAYEAMIEMNNRQKSNQPSSGWWIIDKLSGF